MRTSSFEKFNYALRPAKNIERKMLCEAFGRLALISPLSSYRYVGFGAIGFHDFSIFHQRLGINDMFSIEGNIDAKERVKNNIPYSCITMHWGLSHVVLPTLDWAKRTILWLDYERPLYSEQLKDVSYSASNLLSGSAIIITVPADPGEITAGDNMPEKRLADLRSRLGAGRVPNGVAGKDLVKWGMANVSRKVIVNQIEKTLNDRSAPLNEAEKVKFSQIFNFHYADGIKMLTVGGLILNKADEERLGKQQFADLEFYRPDADSYLIESPLLTWREIKLLDEKLPHSAPDVPEPEWIPESERKKYGKVYRYFPSYSEVEN